MKGEACSKLGTNAEIPGSSPSCCPPHPSGATRPPPPAGTNGHQQTLPALCQAVTQTSPAPPSRAGEHRKGLSCPHMVIIQDQAWGCPEGGPAPPCLWIREDFLEEVTSDLALGWGWGSQ